MYRWSPDVWDSLRLVLAEVPLNHPLYRVDPHIGTEIWGSRPYGDITPEAPTVRFEVDLIPIEAWLSGQNVTSFAYRDCPQSLPSIGLLV